MNFEQLEFDFTEPPPKEELAKYRVELTAGWDGKTIRRVNVFGTKAEAGQAIKTMALSDPKCAPYYMETWTVTQIHDTPHDRLICDFGSWTFFGRITRV